MDSSYLTWPFFHDAHRGLAREIRRAARDLAGHADTDDVDAASRRLVRALGEGGWLRHVVPPADGGAAMDPDSDADRLDVRSICLIREALAYHAGLADFAFAMQGLGTGPITLYGTTAQRERWLPPVVRGEAVAAFAISERSAGSDLAAMSTTARRDGDGFVIDGEKTWTSNAGVADHYAVFARYPEAGERGFAAFMVEATNPGLRVADRFRVSAPHVIGTVVLDGCRVPADALIGEAGAGLRVALGTVDVFRTTVGAAALGFARRALDEALGWVREREVFGERLAGLQLTQAKVADMAVAIDAAALLVYRAAWTRDAGADRITREAAMAKLYATEEAQRVIDQAIQLLGARGVVADAPVERLYREIRALRIYEGTSEIQKIVIAGRVLAAQDAEAAAQEVEAAAQDAEPGDGDTAHGEPEA